MKNEKKERKRVEKTLIESESMHRILFESSPVGIIVADIETKNIIYTNPSICNMLKYSKDKLEKMSVFDIHPHNKIHEIISEFEAQARGERILAQNIPCLKKDGEILYTDINTIKICIDGKDCNLGFFINVTERKIAEEELQKSEAGLKNAQRIAHLGSWDWDMIHNKQQWSDETYRILGLIPHESEVSNDRFLHYIHPDDREFVERTIDEAIKKKEPYSIDYRIIRPDGKERNVNENAEVYFDESGRAIRISGTILDITERKRIEKELIKSQDELRDLTAHINLVREEERSSIARAIHDELGQALTAIKMETSWIKNNLSKDANILQKKIQSVSELIDKAIKTTKEIISELRPAILDDFGLEAALEWYAEEFKKRTGISHEIHTDIKESLLEKNRSTAIFRIFQEALTNVMRHAKASKVKVSVKEENGNLLLTIKDNGKGIKEEEINDPKSFGLIGMRERVLLLKGELGITGVKDKGTTLVATIPFERRREPR